MRTKMTEVTHEKPFDLSSKSKRTKHIKKNERKRQVKKKIAIHYIALQVKRRFREARVSNKVGGETENPVFLQSNIRQILAYVALSG